MLLLNSLDLSLPFRNPVVIFTVVLFIILFAPILLNKIKVPHIIGLIIAGVIIGPYGLNILRRDASIVLLGTVGLLYIMFLAGLEIDLAEFKKNKKKIIFFGLTTFILPLGIGSLACYYVLGYGMLSSLLLASMFSTHTLVSYPIASKYGVARGRAVTLTIGGTMITDILALLILAGIAGITKGEVSSGFWVQLSVSSLVFVGIVFYVFPVVIRWFFKNFEDSVAQYIFVLAMVFLAAFLAEAAGLESIIGAFFSGLILNRFVPHSSPLMNRIDFVGNALFIPFFLIGVGMLVDVSILFKGWGALKVASVILVIAVITKYLAAIITQKVFRLSEDEGRMIFGLSSSHAAATLAIILVGYNIIIGETPTGDPIRLLNEDVLNGTILLILVSCAISSFVVEKAARKLALNEDMDVATDSVDERILVSLGDSANVAEMIDLALLMRTTNKSPVFALHTTDDEGAHGSLAEGKKIIEKAVHHASATENTILPITRVDANINNSVAYTMKEHNVTDLLIGIPNTNTKNNFLVQKLDGMLRLVHETVFVYRPSQPFNTLKRMLVLIPEEAENEPGFLHWLQKMLKIAQEASIAVTFYLSEAGRVEIENVVKRQTGLGNVSYVSFSNWEDFLIIGREIKPNDLLTIVLSRRNNPSYNIHMQKIPNFISTYFGGNSILLVYPRQLETGINMSDVQQVDSKLLETITDITDISKAGNFVRRIFKGDGK